MKRDDRIGVLETFGINDPGKALKDAAKAIFGKGNIPPTQFDISSAKVFKPHISIPTWLRIPTHKRLAPVYNLYNRDVPPQDEPFSVKVSRTRDFMGGQFTYDSHMGTDFAIPVGTHIVTCAPGRVILIENQLDHGGLKISIDHGEGLITTYGHLSRALVEEGDVVGRGQVIARSGAAGLELILFFPWVAPHLHLNVLLNGVAVDPFALEDEGETAMWLNGNNPVPHSGALDSDFTPTEWDSEKIECLISKCTDSGEQDYLRSIPSLEKRAARTISYTIFYNTLFEDFPSIYDKEYSRRAMLDLPLSARDYDGAAFPK